MLGHVQILIQIKYSGTVTLGTENSKQKIEKKII